MAINEKATVEVQVNGEQAKQELKNLEKYANSLKGEIAEAYNAGDTAKVKKLNKELRQTESQMKTLKKDTTALTEVMNNLGSATPKELRATLKAINRELNSGHVKRGSAEWKYYQQQAKLVTRELRNIQRETQETSSWLDRFNNGLSKWGGLAASAVAAVTGVAMTLNTLRNNRNNKEDAQHELKALTGLDDNSIAWLTTQAEELSSTMEKSGLRIRQSSEEILKAYMLVGSKKSELLGNKEALNAVTIEAMRLAAAAKIDLTEAVEATTISLNMFGENADKAAKYVNVLAAGSKAGSASVAAQTASIKNAGVAAATAGVTIEQLNGAIQTLAKKGIEAEPAGTALRKFFLVLQTGADETNPKVVGMDKALENLAAQGLTAGDIQKKFGEEAFSAASILINGIDDYKHFTEAVTGTSVAIEQASINSDTASAKLEQHKNKIKETGIILMEKLSPSLSAVTGWTSKIISVLPTLIDWFIEYKTEIIASSVAIGLYTAAIKASTIATAIHTAKTKVAAAATAALNAVMSASPWGLVLTSATTLAAFLGYKYVSSTNKATTAQREFNKELHKTKEEMDSFQSVKTDSQFSDTMTDKQRAKLRDRALKEKEILQKDLADKEKAYKDAYDVHIDYLMRMEGASEKFKQKAYKAQKEDYHKKMQSLKPMRDAIAEMDAVIKKLNVEESEKDSPVKTSGDGGSKENAAAIAEQKRYQNELLDIKKAYLASDSMTKDEYRRFNEDAEKRHLENMLEVAGLEPDKRQAIMNKLLDLKIKFKEECAKIDGEDGSDSSNDAFSTREKQYQLDVEAATKRHFDSLSSEEDYFKELKDLRNQYYNDVMSSTEIAEEDKARVQQEVEKANLKESEQNYNRHMNKMKQTLAVYQEMGQQFGQQFAQLITDSESSLGDFFKATINMMLDALEKVMIAAVAETQIKNIAKLGPVGMLKAAAEIALITAAFETAKAVISGFEEGGYTGSGRHDEPRGIVHAGEFVANRYAVSNPSVRPVLDLIDTAQRNNTIGSLTAGDVSAALAGRGVSSYSTVNNYNTVDGGMNAVITELTVTIEKLKRRLDIPVVAYTKATGKMGMNEAQRLVDKMNNNASINKV